MKQNIILWTAAFIITFLSGFLQSISSPYYPVSGTFGIEAEKVSYKFDRVHYGKEPYKILIRTDLEGLNGKIEFRRKGEHNWDDIPLINGKEILYAELPVQKTGSELEYRVILFHPDKNYFLPSIKPIRIIFFGKISPFINVLYYITLFAGLLFSTRTGLDFFNENEKIKKLSLFTVVTLFINAFIASPLRRTYELGVIGSQALPVFRIFPAGNLVLFFFWTAAVIFIFNMKAYKTAAIVSAVLMIILFQIFIS